MKSVDRLTYLRERLAEAEQEQAERPRGTVAYKDAIAAAAHLRRLVGSEESVAAALRRKSSLPPKDARS